MAVIVSGKKKWAEAKFDIDCESSRCPAVLEFGIDDVTINKDSTPADYEARDGKHEYEIKCPECGYRTTVGYARTEYELAEDMIERIEED